MGIIDVVTPITNNDQDNSFTFGNRGLMNLEEDIVYIGGNHGGNLGGNTNVDS